MRLDKNINSGIILSFDAVCVGSPIIIMLQKSKYKKRLGILSLIRDHRNKSREIRDFTYTFRYIIRHCEFLLQPKYFMECICCQPKWMLKTMLFQSVQHSNTQHFKLASLKLAARPPSPARPLAHIL